jgi:hypothetical protein
MTTIRGVITLEPVMTTYTINSDYSFGTRVKFASKFNGFGEGLIIGIALNDDSSIYYFIQLSSGDVVGGILPDDIQDVIM